MQVELSQRRSAHQGRRGQGLGEGAHAGPGGTLRVAVGGGGSQIVAGSDSVAHALGPAVHKFWRKG